MPKFTKAKAGMVSEFDFYPEGNEKLLWQGFEQSSDGTIYFRRTGPSENREKTNGETEVLARRLLSQGRAESVWWHSEQEVA